MKVVKKICQHFTTGWFSFYAGRITEKQCLMEYRFFLHTSVASVKIWESFISTGFIVHKGEPSNRSAKATAEISSRTLSFPAGLIAIKIGQRLKYFLGRIHLNFASNKLTDHKMLDNYNNECLHKNKSADYTGRLSTNEDEQKRLLAR